MSQLPTSVRAAVGLAATVVDRLRKLPHEAPELPAQFVTGAMQLSMRAQQELATLITRGDEVLGHLHETPDDPPAWATFDEATTATPEPEPLADVIVVEAVPGASEPAAPVTPVTPVARRAPRKATAKAPAIKAVKQAAAVKKTAAKKTAARKAAAAKSAAKRSPRKSSSAAVASEEAIVRSVPTSPAEPGGSAFDRTPDPEGPLTGE